MKSELHDLINGYYQHRQLVHPSTEDALLFLLSEVGELCEAYISDRWAVSAGDSADIAELEMTTCAILVQQANLGKMADNLVAFRHKWIRNNDRVKEPNIESEIADTLMMLERFAANLGIDPIAALKSKMAEKGYSAPTEPHNGG